MIAARAPQQPTWRPAPGGASPSRVYARRGEQRARDRAPPARRPGCRSAASSRPARRRSRPRARELREETGIDGTFRTLGGALDGVPPGLIGYEEHQAGSKGLHMNFVFVAEVAAERRGRAERRVRRVALGRSRRSSSALESPLNVRQFGYLALDAVARLRPAERRDADPPARQPEPAALRRGSAASGRRSTVGWSRSRSGAPTRSSCSSARRAIRRGSTSASRSART